MRFTQTGRRFAWSARRFCPQDTGLGRTRRAVAVVAMAVAGVADMRSAFALDLCDLGLICRCRWRRRKFHACARAMKFVNVGRGDCDGPGELGRNH